MSFQIDRQEPCRKRGLCDIQKILSNIYDKKPFVLTRQLCQKKSLIHRVGKTQCSIFRHLGSGKFKANTLTDPISTEDPPQPLCRQMSSHGRYLAPKGEGREKRDQRSEMQISCIRSKAQIQFGGLHFVISLVPRGFISSSWWLGFQKKTINYHKHSFYRTRRTCSSVNNMTQVL